MTVVCTVRKEGVAVTLDGRSLFDWKGDFARLSPTPLLKLPHSRTLSLVSFDGQIQFNSVTLKPISGTGKRLR